MKCENVHGTDSLCIDSKRSVIYSILSVASWCRFLCFLQITCDSPDFGSTGNIDIIDFVILVKVTVISC